jgi:GT2 family glycosyltransferase
MSQAPIVFFAYKRPEHTRRSLESLSQNIGAKDSELFIYCDGIKCIEDRQLVELVRQIVRSKLWCGTVHIIEREQNIGLANSIISGVTEICSRYGKVIVLEDDLILSPYFLNYMNTALELYKNETHVMQISGYMFPTNLEPVETDTIFFPLVNSWGWATWLRAWNYFDPEATDYQELKANKKLKYKFNLNNSYPYFDMLESQIKAEIDSWAIRWYLNTFMLQGLTLYPVQSLIQNIGFDGSGTHSSVSVSDFDTSFIQRQIFLFPNLPKADNKNFRLIMKYLREASQPTIFMRLINLRRYISNNF